MNSRPRSVRAALAASLALAASFGCSREGPAAPAGAPRPARPPRVVLVTLDTLRADRVGCYGCELPTTPNLDALAAAGTRFTRASAPIPETGPSHASILTGRQPLGHGLVNHFLSLSGDVTTIAELVRKSGGATAAFYHIFPFAEMNVTQGFDTRSRDITEQATAVVPGFLRWLDALPADQPAFAWLHLYLAHTPLEPPAEYTRRFVTHPYAAQLDASNETLQHLHAHRDQIPPGYEAAFRQIYDSKVAFADQRIGELVSGLRSRGALDDVLLVVTADHGESLEHGMFGMHAVDARQGTLHVPLIVAGPQVGRGRTVDEIVRLVDLFPTMLEPFGGAPPAGVEGVSLRPLLSGAPEEGAGAGAKDGDDEVRVAWGSVPIEPPDQQADRLPRILTLWAGPWKLWVEDPEGESRELLFDLAAGGEQADVAAAHADVVRALRKRLDRCIAATRATRTAPGSLSEKGLEEMRKLGYGGK